MGDEDRETTATSETGKTAQDSGPADAVRAGRPDRAGLLIAGALLAACGGIALYGMLDGEGGAKPKHHTPTASVTYEVTGTGTADLTYQARNKTGKATVVQDARLPWRTTVDVPLGREPIVSIVLNKQGGQARCTLAIRGHHIQTATATGTFGRATCSGTLPATDGNKHN